jgi:hypothetical protein
MQTSVGSFVIWPKRQCLSHFELVCSIHFLFSRKTDFLPSCPPHRIINFPEISSVIEHLVGRAVKDNYERQIFG